ncbi:MAG: hypothetical protein SFX18_18140 [Pirellulales bacterium]|nr:hypothetical protein [Pirellulales bacterium]
MNTRQRTTTDPWRLRVLMACLGMTILCAAAVWWSQRRIYPPASSPESMTLIKQLYTACNTQSTALLEKTLLRMQTALQRGELTAMEHNSMELIANRAKAGEWESATRAMLKYAQDQRRD